MSACVSRWLLSLEAERPNGWENGRGSRHVITRGGRGSNRWHRWPVGDDAEAGCRANLIVAEHLPRLSWDDTQVQFPRTGGAFQLMIASHDERRSLLADAADEHSRDHAVG